MGLNDTIYRTVRSNIIQQDPMPKAKTILAQICKEEQHKYLAKSTVTDERGGANVAFAAGKVLQPLSSPLTVCNHYNRTGHDITNYFQLVGYPECWRKHAQQSFGYNPRASGLDGACGAGVQTGS